MAGTLFIVATPIGNLDDITFRALRVLGEVDLIACEDTRHTRKLLNHYGISTKTISYHEHNEIERAAELVAQLSAGRNVALVSDAGTPAISDPGFRLVQLAREHDIIVVPVPGPTALISALVASGLPVDQFLFAGFLPARQRQRRARLAEVASIPATLIFYETPHRIAESLRDAWEILGDRGAVVARELTKIHEEFIRGRLSELASRIGSGTARGEIVLIIDKDVIEAASKPNTRVSEVMAALEAQGTNSRAALKKAARQLGLSRDEVYRRLVAEKAGQKMKDEG